MQISEMRQQSLVELQESLSKIRRQVFKHKLLRASGQTFKPHELKLARKNIARLLTIVAEKQREGK